MSMRLIWMLSILLMFCCHPTMAQMQKLKIVGQLIGRKTIIDEEAIYQCMLDLHDMGKKITIGRIAGLLDCSSRTIHRNMSTELKKEKNLLNIENEKI